MNTSLRRPATSRSLPHLTTGGVLLVLLSACDLSQPTIPISAEATGAQANELTEPIPLGSSGIQIPNTNGWDQTGATYWQSTPFTVEGWVHIEVSGGVSYTANPDCYYGGFPCSAPLHGATTGPLYSGGSSLIHVGHQSVDAPPATGTGGLNRYLFHPVHGDHQTATAAYTLREHTTPQTIWVRREITYGGSWNPVLAVHDGFQYFLGGSQTITATLVPKPLKVQAPEHVAPGAKGVFRADLGRYQLRRPEGTGPGNFTLIYWMYYPNDTLPNQPSGSYQWVYGCEDKLECEYAPQWPGRMEATAYVEGQFVRDRAGITKLQKSTLELTCPSTAVRAQPITCRVEANPATALTNVSWTFRPDQVTIHPKVGPVSMGVTVEETGPPEWTGPLVLPGTVIARATIGSETLSDSVEIRVTERSWNTASGPAPPRVDLPWGLPPYSGEAVVWGENVHITASGDLVGGVGLLGFDLHSNQPVPANRIRTVDTGPNRGFSYVEVYEIRLNRGYRINKYVTPNNPDRDIRVSPGVMQNRWNALITLGWGDPNVFLQRATQHETFGIAGRIGHQDGLIQAITGEVCGNVARRVERIAGSPSEVEDQLRDLRSAAQEFHFVGTHHHRVHGHMQGARVVVRTRNNASPLLYEMYDRQATRPGLSFRHICEYENWGL